MLIYEKNLQFLKLFASVYLIYNFFKNMFQFQYFC